MLIHVAIRAVVITLATCVLLGAGTASSSPMGVTLGFPDIQATIAHLAYDPNTSEISMTGTVELITLEDLSTVVVSGDFYMTTVVDGSGTFMGGSFTMFDGSTLLLSADLTGINGTDHSLEFMYDVTGGTVGADYDAGGLVLGLREGGGFGFIAHAAPIATSPVPEPSAGLLFLVGGVVIASRQTRRRN